MGCRVCKIKFPNQHLEKRHRETRKHRETMDAAAMQEVWKCQCCNFTVTNTGQKVSGFDFDEHDSKREFIRHLLSKEHGERYKQFQSFRGDTEVCLVGTH